MGACYYNLRKNKRSEECETPPLVGEEPIVFGRVSVVAYGAAGVALCKKLHEKLPQLQFGPAAGLLLS